MEDDFKQINLGFFNQCESNNEEKMSLTDYRIKKYNEQKCDNKIYDCKKCGNKGLIAYNQNGSFMLKRCDCYKKRLSREKLNGMGLLQFVDENNSFDSYIAREEWEKRVKQEAIEFTYEKERKTYFFYLGGAVGSGKTTICTTIFANLITELSPEEYEYYNWDNNLRTLVFADKDRQLMEQLKQCKVLYIDDFLRQTARGGKMEMYERNLAKELIDYRYMRKLITIISSEIYYSELLNYDDAIASRIKQYGRTIAVKRDSNRNKRLAEKEEIL